MTDNYVRSAVPVYPGITEHCRLVTGLINLTGLDEFSIYRGVMVFWDTDYDTRVLTFLDNNENIIPNILAVAERKAYLTILWLDMAPDFNEEMAGVNKNLPSFVEVAGDNWQVESYKTCSNVWLPILKAYMKKVV